ncbi:unnamed protein product [Lactuca saligna]|uniref:Uncharacterized protein n=1 Tax=Lactuca saligna TaxID=75948 RepID=A0AA35V9X3_LACSI|nr:unnamed protein product [Lactuca saligna]
MSLLNLSLKASYSSCSWPTISAFSKDSSLDQQSCATLDDPFIHSRAAYYSDSDDKGLEIERCGYGSFGATINNVYVASASNLYKDGLVYGTYSSRSIEDVGYVYTRL